MCSGESTLPRFYQIVEWRVSEQIDSSTRRAPSTHKLVVTARLSTGEIHSDWREVIATGAADKKLPVILTSPNTSHESSDDCGAIILGMQEERANWDKIGANMNAVRNQTLLKEADVVVVRFGEKYRQWVSSILLSSTNAKYGPLDTHFPMQTLHFRMPPLMPDTRRPWENQSLRFTHRRYRTC